MSSRWKHTSIARIDSNVFTGIIEELGTVKELAPRAAGARLTVRCTAVLGDLTEGGSIAVNGVCLTALEVARGYVGVGLAHAVAAALGLQPGSFSADLAPETLERSNLGDLKPGLRVNLERPVTPATRLSGHIVQGHVDATGEIAALDALGDGNYWLKVRVPAALDRYLVHKGSIALDGISLTIAALENGDAGAVVGVTIIPHTFANTTLGTARAGSRINVEVDVLAKHVEKLMASDGSVLHK